VYVGKRNWRKKEGAELAASKPVVLSGLWWFMYERKEDCAVTMLLKVRCYL
jgi:hypothetical protein